MTLTLCATLQTIFRPFWWVLYARRTFLSKFSFQGESHETDRILQGFAARYFSHCTMAGLAPGDEALLTSAVVMLNGDLHNPVSASERFMHANAAFAIPPQSRPVPFALLSC